MAQAGVTHDFLLDFQGYMLGQSGRSGGSSYRKWGAGGGEGGMYPVNATNAEALQGTLPAAHPEPFRRVFWGNWRGLGCKFATAEGAGGEGFRGGERAGLVNDLVGLRPVLEGAALALTPMAVDATLEALAPVF